MRVHLNDGKVAEDYNFALLAKEVHDYLKTCVFKRLDDGLVITGHASPATIATLVAEEVQKEVRGFPFLNEELLAFGADQWLNKVLTDDWIKEKTFYQFKEFKYNPVYHR